MQAAATAAMRRADECAAQQRGREGVLLVGAAPTRISKHALADCGWDKCGLKRCSHHIGLLKIITALPQMVSLYLYMRVDFSIDGLVQLYVGCEGVDSVELAGQCDVSASWSGLKLKMYEDLMLMFTVFG